MISLYLLKKLYFSLFLSSLFSSTELIASNSEKEPPKNRTQVKLNLLKKEVNEGEINNEKLKNMTNREFLGIPEQGRLKYITKESISSEEISNGSKRDVEFSFTYNGVFNKKLYMLTTAGQVLPKEVMEVEFSGIRYKRLGLKGEFFSKNNKRLAIHEGTKLSVTRLLKEKEVTFLEDENKKIIKGFLRNNPEKSGIEYLLKASVEKGIDIKFASILLRDAIKNEKDLGVIAIEEALTEVHRIIGKNELSTKLDDKGRYPDKFAVILFSNFSSSKISSDKKVKDYGVKKNSIEEHDKQVLNGEALWNNLSFQKKIAEICGELGANSSDMKKLMTAESGINLRAINSYSNATGLIQFMPKTAKYLGTTVEALYNMSGIEQLYYVKKYFLPYKGKLKTFEDLYLATFYPYAIGKGNDFIFGSEVFDRISDSRILAIANQNPIISKGKNKITLAMFKEYVKSL